ncbi:hypothetical protein M422DRAFT_36799 [Sphaerobolus stellatus SS14]|uniref:HOOK N-terminal domain-containing protein n=1 Tax=Sphaerobolus stellatus (strain SS14) TaxID=990650 RepID=A0A0C9U6K5_SPHS4|nr:hypothetical protein M422DRAFT_36799 [Sphaerobolus stellatus SS14]
MDDSLRNEADAFLDFLSKFELSRPVAAIADLSDGAALFDVLSIVDETYFRPPTRPSSQLSDNWVLRFSALKRLYRLITQYFVDVLDQPTSALDVPDLQAIAKDHDAAATLILCRLSIVIAVQSQKNKEVIEKIQSLNETKQHVLMKAIEQVMSNFRGLPGDKEQSMTDDDHYYQIQSERSHALSEKETLEKVYQQLLEEHRTLQTSHDDVLSEKDDAISRLKDLQHSVDRQRNEKADVLMRGEIDRLRLELQKSEENLNAAEADLEKRTASEAETLRKNTELQALADQAARLKDQVDEYRHAAEKLQKTENVMEKYKKKLEESADLRRSIKALEEQNASLVDKNAALEEEYRKVAAFRPLMESYKTQIADLETKNSNRAKENDALKYQLEQAHTKIRISAEERAKDSEALELYQDRVRELELMSTRRPRAKSTSSMAVTGESSKLQQMTEAELLGLDDDPTDGQGLGEELDDAITGTTMTDLKLQVRQLQRELEAARTNQTDASRLLVLENLLDDATRMKTKYEADYLGAHREKLVLQNQLEEIREGKMLGDGAEAAIALRQRLNETVEELDSLKKEHAELEVKYEAQVKELTIAKSDLNLVNKDQLEILGSLRESVNEDKIGMETEMDKLRKHIRDLSDKNKMQLEQVNALLLEKVNLQSEGIGQRERMLERERDYGNLRASLNGRNLSEEDKARILEMHEKIVRLEEECRTTKEQLLKARAFIKNQDKLFREREEAARHSLPSTFEEAETSFRSQIKILEEETTRAKRQLVEATKRYQKEQLLLLSTIQTIGMQRARGHLADAQSRPEPTSWLLQQRRLC